jgi:hypothetical protein
MPEPIRGWDWIALQLDRHDNFSRDRLLVIRALKEVLGDLHYCVIGGVAVVHYGYDRMTKDVDILLEEKDWKRAFDVLKEADGWEAKTQELPTKEGYGYTFVHEETKMEVDCLPGKKPFGVDPTNHKNAVDSSVCSLPLLVLTKLLRGELTDQGDIDRIFKAMDEQTRLENIALILDDSCFEGYGRIVENFLSNLIEYKRVPADCELIANYRARVEQEAELDRKTRIGAPPAQPSFDTSSSSDE